MNPCIPLLLLTAITLGGCRDSTSRVPATGDAGTVVIATTADPDALFPPSALNMPARQATELIYEYLADVGPDMNTLDAMSYVKELAAGWAWNADSTAITFSLNPNAAWQDGKPVTSRDVAFSFRVYTDTLISSNGVTELSDVDSVTTPDSSRATFWFSRRTAHQFYDAASLMLILPEHIFGKVQRDSLKAFASRTDPVGSGKYRLTRRDKGSSIELGSVHNHYRGTAQISRLIWTVAPEYKSATLKLLGGEADIVENVRPETIPELEKSGNYKVVSLPGMDYAFMRFNFRDASGTGVPHALFGSRPLRQAVTMLIDRRALVKNLFDTLATVGVGPTVRAFPSTDTTIISLPFDPLHARRLLDSLGWKLSAGEKVRTRSGRPFRFTALVPVSSSSRMRIAVLIQEQLRREGIDMQIEQMDLNAFNARQDQRSFDVAFGAWHLGSQPGGIRDTWTTSGAAKGGLNYGGYSNLAFDTLVDSALSASTIAGARFYFRKALQVTADDAPAVWLYEPRTLIAIQKRIRTTSMRPSAWWIDIGSWTIPPAERIARDKVKPSK